MGMSSNIPERSALRPEDQWDLSALYPSDAAWQEDYERARRMGENLASYRGRLASSAGTLLEFAQLEEALGVVLENLGNYAQRKSDEDTRVSAYQSMTAKFVALEVEIASALAFETPELMAVPDDTLEQFYQELPALEIYRRSFWDVRRRREHILSDE